MKTKIYRIFSILGLLAFVWSVGLGIHIWQQERGFRATITDLTGYTGYVGDQDIAWGTPGVGVGAEETFNVPSPTGGVNVLRKIYDEDIPCIGQVNTYVGELFRAAYSAIIYPEDIITAGPWIDSRRYSATDLSVVAAAVNALGSDVRLIIPTQYQVTSNVTFNDNVHVFAYPDAYLVGAGSTVDHDGSFWAGAYQVCSGNGAMTFERDAVPYIRPVWYGADPEGSGDSTGAIQKAIDAAELAHLQIRPLEGGQYLISDPLVIESEIDWKGGSLLVSSSYNDSIFHFLTTSGDLRYCKFDDIYMNTSNALYGTYTAIEIDLDGNPFTYNTMENLVVRNCSRFVRWTGTTTFSTDVKFVNCKVSQFDIAIAVDSTVSDVHTILFDRCSFTTGGGSTNTLLDLDKGFDFHFANCTVWADSSVAALTVWDFDSSLANDQLGVVVSGGTWEVPVTAFHQLGVQFSGLKSHDIQSELGGQAYNLYKTPFIHGDPQRNLCRWHFTDWVMSNATFAYASPDEYWLTERVGTYTVAPGVSGYAIYYLAQATPTQEHLWNDPDMFLGEPITSCVWVRTDEATKVRVWIEATKVPAPHDNYYSQYHPGDDEWHLLCAQITPAVGTSYTNIYTGLAFASLAGGYDVDVAGPVCTPSQTAPFYTMRLGEVREIPWQTLPVDDRTPSVQGYEKWITANTGALPGELTMFDGGIEGQEIWILCNETNTSFDFGHTTATNIWGNGDADFSCTGAGDLLRCVYSSGHWYCIAENVT